MNHCLDWLCKNSRLGGHRKAPGETADQKPVSYTHLEVFVRSMRASATSVRFVMQEKTAQTAIRILNGFQRARSQDVYKRQEFDLRLGSGRTDTEPCAVIHIVVENIGLRKTCLLYFARRDICDRVLLVIADRSYLVAAKRLRRIRAEVLHELLDLRKSLNAL